MKLNLKTTFSLIILVPMLVWAAGPGKAQRSVVSPQLARANGLGVDANDHDSRKIAWHDGNKILTRFYNFAAISNWRIAGRYDCGIYPIGSGHSYMAEFTPLIASQVKDARGLTQYIISDGTSASAQDVAPSGYLYQFEPVLGYANPNDSLLAMSDDSISWPDTWPGKPDSWDGKWNGQYGQYNRADQESYFHVDDFNNDEFNYYSFYREGYADLNGRFLAAVDADSSRYGYLIDADVDFTTGVVDLATSKELDTRGGDRPDVVQINGERYYSVEEVLDEHTLLLESVRASAAEDVSNANYTIWNGIKRGLGMDVSARGYQWAHPAAEDILIWTYWIENVSDRDYEKFVFGMYGDADVGDDGDQYDDDSMFETVDDIVYQWDHDMWSPVKGGFEPAYFGWKYLESPGNPLDGVDNDEDGMIDESQDDGIDNDGDWDPRIDDVGTDGLGPQHGEYTGPDADGTEGNGVPDPGEPNFEYTDNDESDQLGLTSFTAAAYPAIAPSDDALTWTQLVPGSFTDIAQTVDITFMYGSAYFKLPRQEERKFAVAMLFGEDFPDILRNSQTMQQIYNSDYSFAKPPLKPTVTAVAGDRRVTLYWDSKAELSQDPIYGRDFEGYRIYRATDPAFNESWVITDAYGNRTFNKPIAQFDIVNGLTGPHPIGLNGLQMDMGTDNGLVHSWTDTTVENGQQYYYAVVAYDQGYANDFYERGITEMPNLQEISPSETNKKIEVSASGTVVAYDDNTVGVIPNAPAIDYMAPEVVADTSRTLSTGSFDIQPVDPNAIQDGSSYEIRFRDWSNDGVDNDGDWQTFTDDSLFITMSSTLTMIIPPNSDTLNLRFSNDRATVTGPNVTRFTAFGYFWATTTVSVDTTNGTPFYYVAIPDTQLVIPPTLGIWNGTENLHDDLGTDGCNDEYEDGSGGCLDAPDPGYVAGTDPNGDNWHPTTNRFGTQANAQADPGEPHLDMRDIDEIVRFTSWYDVVNTTTDQLILQHQTELSGENRGEVAEGIQINLTNDVIGLDLDGSGWSQSGLNMTTRLLLINYGNFQAVATPFDYVMEVTPTIVDTAKNMKFTAFSLYDQTNQQSAEFIYLPVENDTLIKDGGKLYPYIEVEGQQRVGYQMEFVAIAANINHMVKWQDVMFFATGDRGLILWDGTNWLPITQTDGLAANAIYDMVVDASDRLWVATSGGLNLQTPYGWETYGIPKGDKGALTEFNGLTIDTDGNLWATSPDGVFKTSLGTIAWSNYDETNDGLAQLSNVAIVALDSGKVLAGSKSRGLSLYHPVADSFTVIDRNNSDLPDNNIQVLTRRGNRVFIGTRLQGFAVYNDDDGTIEYTNKDSLLDRGVSDILIGADNVVLLATKDGVDSLTYVDKDNVTYHNPFTRESDPGILSDNVQTLFLENDELWFGTKYNVARRTAEGWNNFNPQPGDKYVLRTTKPFSGLDTLRFTSYGARVTGGLASSVLDDIAVVPNPYVVTASWEPQHLYSSGRGTRKIDFIHLPSQCTIRIYTMSGKLVDTIEHDAPAQNGAQSWDLLSRDGLEIAYGMYIYHVDAPGIGTKVGKFAVIK
ncbi:MAG: hypothetical protein K9N34_01385 [Candidatus Marinimicrobia bacterium]|nr:hypothetical protein [Candidatus Neomarinimicrobiota bacterium]MCF7840019.1 hypothetical protein [Candidatus Neomarinimicrobiota bacterium]MCF7902131.1 hypothetical protein [Candidatus Neomarinimicrobiota bacterium]